MKAKFIVYFDQQNNSVSHVDLVHIEMLKSIRNVAE